MGAYDRAIRAMDHLDRVLDEGQDTLARHRAQLALARQFNLAAAALLNADEWDADDEATYRRERARGH